MIILLYPERKDATIGRFDEPDVETCALVLGTYKELDLIAEGFEFCNMVQNPVSLLQDFDQNICNIVVSDGETTRVSEDFQMGVRITKDELLSLASDKQGKAYDQIKADIVNMALTANEIMDAAASRRNNTICPDDLMSVIGSMAEVFDIVLNQGVPLRDRFAILEDGVDDDLAIYERVINAIVNGDGEEDD